MPASTGEAGDLETAGFWGEGWGVLVTTNFSGGGWGNFSALPQEDTNTLLRL